jgi:DNA-binding NarL/FixJ family response regulator
LIVCQPGLFADGFARLLADLGDEVSVHVCSTEAIGKLSGAPDLVVVDLDPLNERSAQVVDDLISRLGAPLVTIANTLDNALMTAVLRSGAKAYLTKSFSHTQALGVIRQVLDEGYAALRLARASASRQSQPGNGEAGSPHRPSAANPYGLTRGEMKVLGLLCEGLSNLGIAKRLGIQEGTVKIHLNKAYEKMGVQNRTQAVKVAERLDAIRDLQLERAEEGSSLFDWLLPHMTHETRRKGEVLFRKGDPGQALYYIQQGRVALQEIGKMMGEGELLGEIGIFAPEHARTCTATCETDTRLFRLTAEQAKRLYLENPRFAYHVVQLIAERLLADRARSN